MLLGAALYVVFTVPIFYPESTLARLVEKTFLSLGLDLGFVGLWTIVAWNLLLLMVTVMVVVDSVRKVRAGKTRNLATGVLIVKLAAIPFFLLNFAILGIVTGAGVQLIILPFFVLAIGVPLTWLAMVSTSVYGWATIIRLRREGSLRTSLAVLYILGLATFVVDIAVGIELFGRSRRRSGVGLAVALLALLAFGIFIFSISSDWPFEWLCIPGVAIIVITVAVPAVVLIRRAVLRRRAHRSQPLDGVGAEPVSTSLPVEISAVTSKPETARGVDD